ncbi:hypothetical protein Lfu02_13610 [Longispora fulva]|uniref:Archaellum biogenesis ATPase FlaH/cell division septum initiation protein DivIVA n=1 Tax=Longispora fulva TaxID=619741 RepID=A0A8J7KML2_9ACTN|nr:hypothetical protein [Longispora fulva]MBG6140629.1 archaellum biogenesis ATPase FlaH/cell division septum initiation protein DivIVA [Longispora fulva]GIG56989.1 hypothetical protein Lfu02_13610 [Longispora fulva]
MRFTIKSECRRGLRIIEEIPDIGLCRIEGHNGIGKSTALRLLQLCTGFQPYEREHQAWSTLRQQLTAANIVVTDLRGANRIEWAIDTSRWPAAPGFLGDQVGRIKIDGKNSNISDVRELLQVHRLVGHESLIDTMSGPVGDAALAVGNWMSTGGQGWERRAALDHLLAEIQEKAAGYDLASYHGDHRRLKVAELRTIDLDKQLRDSKDRLSLLEEALLTSVQLEEVRGFMPGLEEQLTELNGEIAKVEDSIKGLDEEITHASERTQRDQDAQKEFVRAQKHLEQRESALTKAVAAFSSLAQAAKVDTEASEIESALTGASQRLDNLVAELPHVHATPLVVALLRSLTECLREAEESGISDQVVFAVTSLKDPWTVRTLRTSLEGELAKRVNEPPSMSALQVEAQIVRARDRVGQLSSLAMQSEAVNDLSRKVKQARGRLEKAAAELPEGAAITVRDLLSRRASDEEHIRSLRAREQQVLQARSVLGGGKTEQDLTQQLAALCRNANVDQSRLRSEHDAAQAQMQSLQIETPLAQSETTSLKNALNERVRNIDSVVASLREAKWLPGSLAKLLENPGTGVESQLQILTRLHEAADSARERLGLFVNDVQAIGEALGSLAKQFQGGPRYGEQRWAAQVQGWLASEVNHWFEHPEVRDALFDGGTDVALDLQTMEVSWSVNGQRLGRPLQAFSSGQQALAYTRARLSRLDRTDEHAQNRLIALDEFGAFIAADGMRSLTGYLTDRRKAIPQDQIIVVLPLSEDLRTPISQPSDKVAASRLRQLQDRGYFAEELVR